MSKRRVYITLAIIFFLAIFAGLLNYPAAWNKAADYLNSELGIGVPHFFNIPFKLGLDLQGGMHLIYQADLSNIAKQERGPVMDGLKDVIERRVNLFGVREPVVQAQKERLVVELAGIIDPGEAIKQIGKTPFLEFKEQKEDSFQSTPLTGRYLKKAEISFDQQTYQPLVLLEFNDEGAKIFEELTAKNIGKQLAIYIDGIPLSTPVVQEKISGGKARITGTFSIDEAKKLAQNLNAGALPVPIKLISQQTVGPTLGKISLEKSLKAGILGFLMVIIFMIGFYRLPGVLASLALAIYVVLILAIFKLISVTLTLSGIAGFILSIGMAVDANILIFSRMREELKLNKSFLISVGEGFRRAWPSIKDSNLNTLIVSAIFFFFGTGFVKGFAFTLILGVLVSMFSAVFVTQNLLKLFQDAKIGKYKILW